MPAERVAAVFATKEETLAAARRLFALGYADIETYSPYPLEELDDLLARPRPAIAPVVFLAGAFGAALAVGGQHWLNAVDYPIEVGGRPTASWITYVVIAFELTILFAAVAAFAATLLGARLPRLHDPVFDGPDFERATVDRFWLTFTDVGGGDELRDVLAEAEAIHRLEVPA